MKTVQVAALVGLMALAGTTLAQKKVFTQKYHDKWEETKTASGYVVASSRYTATDAKGKVVRDNLVQIFTNAPKGGNTDKSNYWVYWMDPKTKTIWGRCPTPKHPRYKEWVKAEGNPDLWQIIPKGDRKKGEVNLDTLAPLFAKTKTVSTKNAKVPTIDGNPPEDDNPTIDCIDFDGGISRYTR